MRHFIVVFTLLSVCLGTSVDSNAASEFGISVAPAFVDLMGREELEPLKFEVGAQLRTPINAISAFRTGVIYRTLGTYVDGRAGGDAVYRTGYVSVPFEVEFRSSQSPSRSPIFGVGASADILTRAKPGNFGTQPASGNPYHLFRRLNWSLVGTVGLNFGSWSARLRGSHSIRSVWRESHSWREDRNRSVALELVRWLST